MPFIINNNLQGVITKLKEGYKLKVANAELPVYRMFADRQGSDVTLNFYM